MWLIEFIQSVMFAIVILHTYMHVYAHTCAHRYIPAGMPCFSETLSPVDSVVCFCLIAVGWSHCSHIDGFSIGEFSCSRHTHTPTQAHILSFALALVHTNTRIHMHTRAHTHSHTYTIAHTHLAHMYISVDWIVCVLLFFRLLLSYTQ